MPRIDWAVDLVTREQRWLPFLAPQLPMRVPLPVASGHPDDAFPYPWTVVQWLPGEMASLDRLADPVEAALQLANFVRALEAVDPSGGPDHHRGRPVRLGDEIVRKGIARLAQEADEDLDTAAISEAWARAVSAPDHDGPPVWFHGDLAYLNLLARDGQLASVIDWGTCGVGDPAIDTIIAWSLSPPDARWAYGGVLGLDEGAWERGKGWVLPGLFGILSYRHTNPVLADDKRKAIQA